MFNMYDDMGIKEQIANPYKVNKLLSVAPTHRKKDKTDDQQASHSKFEDMINSEAKEAYKKIANIHIEEEMLHAYQLMQSDVVTIYENDTISQCWLKMEEYDLKQIPLIGFDGKIKGLATLKNIMKAIVSNIQNSEFIYETPIASISIRDVMTAEPVADIRRIASVMVQYHLNSIPIVDGKKDEVVGIISRADILKAISSHPHFQLWA